MAVRSLWAGKEPAFTLNIVGLLRNLPILHHGTKYNFHSHRTRPSTADDGKMIFKMIYSRRLKLRLLLFLHVFGIVTSVLVIEYSSVLVIV